MEISRLTGTGIRLWRAKDQSLFFLALAFCSWVRNGYGVFRYSDKELLFLASINGQPAVAMADLSGMMPTLPKGQPFLAMNEGAPENGRLYRLWNILITGKYITRLSSADLAVANLLSAIAANSLPAVLFLVAAGAGTVFWMTQ